MSNALTTANDGAVSSAPSAPAEAGDAAVADVVAALPQWGPSGPDWRRAVRAAGFDDSDARGLAVTWFVQRDLYEVMLMLPALIIAGIAAAVSRHDGQAIGWTVFAIAGAIAVATGMRPLAHLNRVLHQIGNITIPTHIRSPFPSRRARRALPTGMLAFGTIPQMRDLAAEIVHAMGGPRTALGVDRWRRPIVSGFLPTADRVHVVTSFRLAADAEVDAFAPFLKLDVEGLERARSQHNRARVDAGTGTGTGTSTRFAASERCSSRAR